MLPYSQRVRKEYFEEIFKKGSFFGGKFLNLNILKKSKNSLKYSCFAFSVSQKVSKSAVLRNKLRRRGYSIIQKKIENIKPGYLCVFVLKKGVLDLNFDQLSGELEKLLNKADLFLD